MSHCSGPTTGAVSAFTFPVTYLLSNNSVPSTSEAHLVNSGDVRASMTLKWHYYWTKHYWTKGALPMDFAWRIEAFALLLRFEPKHCFISCQPPVFNH